MALLAPVFERGLKPALGQVKSAVQERLTFGAGVANEDSRLAIGGLAQRPTILRGDSYRGCSFFGKLARVDAPDSLFVIQTFCGDFPVSFSHPRLIPLVVAHEPLEIAHPIWAVQSQGDRLDVLSFRVTQQPLHMKFKQ